MTLPTHIMAGLIVGKVTGNYPVAIITSVVFDLDHFFFYYTRDLIFRPVKVFKKALRKKIFIKGRRGIFHSVFTWIMVSALFMLINFPLGVTVSASYLVHLILDVLDDASFYPFYPLKVLNLRGPITYFSFSEVVFLAIITLAYYLTFNLIVL